ncbi:hypothetical protein [Rummeliibacillus stabekisii]|uniref:Uncharacterized protein n=1 Tax=Rummeliibacillus stabekisii TaxID=241244 RepID=A0A143H8B5_9BACL|nr:hypothetical protein [Rummeliibacillus stabekisii]AMW97942.1 hypothetical protein ATY39_00075 [Rummeliibacillus stabekisii]
MSQKSFSKFKPAKVVKVEEGKFIDTETLFSEKVMVYFATKNHMVFKQSYLTAIGYDYKINKLVDTVLGEDCAVFDYEEMVGKKVGILVKPKEYKGNIYQNVVDVCPIEKV